jgi:DNA-binding transcriptional ArsR family regulator
MVEDQERLDGAFHALAHPARRDMLRRLAGGELTVGELAAPVSMSLAAASKHIQVLERAGLVRRTVAGRRHVCRLDPAPLASASEWLGFYERYWNERLDDLQALVENDEPDKGKRR